MALYRITTGSLLRVKARSKIHDTTTVWDAIEGTVEADADSLATTGANVAVTVDMTRFDAGDFLKNRKLRKDFDMDAHPQATFTLTGLRDVTGDGVRFRATADGVLRMCLLREKEIDLLTPLRNGAMIDDLRDMILQGVWEKPWGHGLADGIIPLNRAMNEIGG